VNGLGEVTAAVMAVLCRALPAALRETYGAEIVGSFRAGYDSRRQTRGRVSAVVFASRSVLDLVITVARERAGVRKDGRRMRLEVGTELRRAVRSLLRSPGFSAGGILVLSLGIGVNAAMFTALKSLLLTSPAYPSAERLVLVDLVERTSASGSVASYPWSYPKFERFRAVESGPFEQLAGFSPWSATLVTETQSVKASLEFVSWSYLTMLGARPASGRLFGAAEDEAAAPSAVAILSHRFWMSQFGGDAAVVGRVVEVESKPVEIAGVMSPGFVALTGDVDMWMPMTSSALLLGRPMVEQAQAHWFRVVGRLREGVTLTSAAARSEDEVRRAAAQFASPMPGTVMTATVTSLRDARVHPAAKTAVLVLSGAALLVLLIACANLAGLLLARGLERRREIAVQVALGARRSRVMFGLLAESLTLAAAGGTAGLAVAQMGVVAMRSVWPERFAMSAGSGGGFAALRAIDVRALSLDPVVIAFAAGLALLTGLVFGLIPALQLSSVRGNDALRYGARLTGAERTERYRSALIAGEVALALVLLVGAGLMMGTLVRLIRVDRGFDAVNVLTFSYGIPRTSARAQNVAAFHEELLEQLRAAPRIVGAAAGCMAPMAGRCQITSVSAVQGMPSIEASDRPEIGMHRVSDGWFETMRVPLMAGRSFNALDRETTLPVTLLNRTAVRRLFGAEDPLGRTISVPGKFGESQDYTVVGVVGDVLHGAPADGVMAEAYLSMRQAAPRDVSIVVRTAGNPLDVVPAIRERLRALEPGIALANVRTAKQIDAGTTADTRAMLWLLGVFAVSAALLSAVGIWSVVAYAVNRRSREIGVRMALGAHARDVVTMVARRGVRAALLGLLLGVPVALAGSRLLQVLLFGMQPTDARVYVMAAAALCAIAFVASWVPARRATSVDPVRAMRAD
jgi:putative ABC transport system permease protein